MNYRVLGIVAGALVVMGIAFIVSFIVNNRVASDEVETIITLAPTSPAEDYAAAQLKRKAAKRHSSWATDGSPTTRHDHDTVENSYSVESDANGGDMAKPEAMDSELAKLEALESKYQAALSSASPEVASMMEAIRAHVESLSPEEAINLDHDALIQQYLPD